MRSSLPKVLHGLAGKPMLTRVLDALQAAGFPSPTVLVGYGAEAIREAMGDRCRYVVQEEQRGTGHAALVALRALPPNTERVLLVHGDEPLIPAGVYGEMLALAERSGVPIVLLTTRVSDTRGFGRVIREDAEPVALVQEADLAPEQRAVNEVNLGAYVFDASFLARHLPSLQPHPPKGELYLTDLVAEAVRERGIGGVAALEIDGGEAVMGINDLVQLEAAGAALYHAVNRQFMAAGVTIVSSATTFIDEEVEIEPEVVIHPFSIITGRSRIGSGSVIGPNARIDSSTIGARCRIEASTLESAEVEDEVGIGPYAHLRPGARIKHGAEIGNYAEVKASTIGVGSRMHHFSYVGDAVVGDDVNIGAGTVTVNYDGRAKHRTVIGDGAFVGSGSMLRAPVEIGERAITGTGSVVLHDVPAGAVVAGVPARTIREAPQPESEEAAHAAGEPGA
jgi:bifunctional UDP-N-acetylglucosamine pyrophosphorylase/glucosamine-1-phosphate N-acetyltransferase